MPSTSSKIDGSQTNRSLIRFSTAGSVDDGKSSLIGRLLLDRGAIYQDTLASIEKASSKIGSEHISLALVTDGLKAEQEQGITIDVAYRYFSTAKRNFILADAPGHEQYTRNMATAASTADLTILLIDATKGILPQTKRHAFIAALMGVPRLLIAVNKMDLVDYSEDIFEQIKNEFSEFGAKLGIRELRFIPISALLGVNVVKRSTTIPWYNGESVLNYLEDVYVAGDGNAVDFRFPIQTVIRTSGTYRGYAGQIASGRIHKGDEITIIPSMLSSKVERIEIFGCGEDGLSEARAPQSVILRLSDEIDIGRGDMIVRRRNQPHVKTEFDAMIVWMADKPLDPACQYIIQHTTSEAKAIFNAIQYRVDINTLSRVQAEPLQLNEIGRVSLTTSKALALDSYTKNRATGNFILIDPLTFNTVAAGMVVERSAEHGLEPKTAQNLHREESLVEEIEREKRSGWRARTVWLFGLSGAGKSTLAKRVERILFDMGCPIVRLDGDNLRGGLNSNLGFTSEDRSENLRRAAEVAKLLNQAGVTVLSSFITPTQEDRERIKSILGPERLTMVFLSASLDICEERDSHGLYKKARSGEIKNFTGISSPFEVPTNVDLTIDSGTQPLEQSIEQLVALLLQQQQRS